MKHFSAMHGDFLILSAKKPFLLSIWILLLLHASEVCSAYLPKNGKIKINTDIKSMNEILKIFSSLNRIHGGIFKASQTSRQHIHP